ncbi:hypothetical protein ACE1OC_40265 [Streptomyces sp. DSM 116496]|uniref:hypothetical protein n=1 Tax=Streptomyces stoeckheimensis TaxID=3344656 RepID=UPI0038B40002
MQAHLGLVPGALEVGDEFARDLAGERRAVVLLDEREGEVEGAGDPGGGGDLALADEEGTGVSAAPDTNRRLEPRLEVG